MYWQFKTRWQNGIHFMPLFRCIFPTGLQMQAGMSGLWNLWASPKDVTLYKSVMNSRKKLYAASYWIECKLPKSLPCNRMFEGLFIQVGGGVVVCAFMCVWIDFPLHQVQYLNSILNWDFSRSHPPVVFNMISIAVIGCFKFWRPTYAVEYSNKTVTHNTVTHWSFIGIYAK